MKTWLGFVVGFGMVACTETSGSGAATDAVDERHGDGPAEDGGLGPKAVATEGGNGEPTTPAEHPGERDAGNGGSGPGPTESNHGGEPTDGGLEPHSGTGCSGATGDAAVACALSLVPEGCEFLAVRAEEPKCHFAAACQQVQKENIPRLYTLTLETDGVESESPDAEGRLRCLERWVSEFVPGEVEGSPGSDTVTLFATWDQAAVLTRTAALHSVDLGCPEWDTEVGSCDYCWQLGEQDCASDAFCTDALGERLNTEAVCLESREFLSCHPQFSCGDIGPAYYRAPDGECYFTAMEGECWLDGYEFDASCEALFQLADAGADRPCSDPVPGANDAGASDAGAKP